MQRLTTELGSLPQGKSQDICTTPLAVCVKGAGEMDKEEALDTYKRYLFLVIRGAVCPPTQKTNHEVGDGARPKTRPKKKQRADKGSVTKAWWGLNDLQSLYEQGGSLVEETFCVETGSDKKLPASSLLGKNNVAPPMWYASFILQKDKELFSSVLSRLPLDSPSFLSPPAATQSEALWFFFGSNTSGEGNMDGRPEHTDQITHSGTWHLQLSGQKQWTIRPNPQAEGWSAEFGAPKIKGRIRVVLNAGDVIVINTNAWFHATAIPDTSQATDCLSLSYARDFFLRGTQTRECEMTNIEGTWASHAIRAGDCILRERPVACAQEVGNRRDFLACAQCFRPLLSPAQHAYALSASLSRMDIINSGSRVLSSKASFLPTVPHNEFVQDSEFGACSTFEVRQGEVYCSPECAEGRTEHKHPAQEATKKHPKGKVTKQQAQERLGEKQDSVQRGARRRADSMQSMSESARDCQTAWQLWLRPGGVPPDHPLHAYTVHTLRHGHYQSFALAAQIIADAVSKRSRGDTVENTVAMYAAMNRAKRTWWDMVADEEEGEEDHEEDISSRPRGKKESSHVLNLTMYKERNQGFGITVSNSLAVTHVEVGGVAEAAGVREGDVVVSLGGSEVVKGGFQHAVSRVERESADAADSMMVEGFSTAWVGVEIAVRRSDERDAARKRVKSTHGSAEKERQTKDKSTVPPSDCRESASVRLRGVLEKAWRLLVDGLSERMEDETVQECVTLQLFQDVMAGVHAASWEVNSIDSPLALYCQALRHSPKTASSKALRVLTPIVHQLQEQESDDDRDQNDECASNSDDGHRTRRSDSGSHMNLDELEECIGLLPRMSVQVLFKVCCALDPSDDPNCEVVMCNGEGGLEAMLVATKDIAAGDPLTVGASSCQDSDDDESSDDE